MNWIYMQRSYPPGYVRRSIWFAYKELKPERMSLSVSDQPTSPHCWGIDSRDYLVPNTS